MELCFLAKVFFLLSIIGISFDIYLAGFTTFSFLQNVVVTVLFVFITNWFCFTQSYNWVAWVIVSITFITVIATIYIVNNKNQTEIKKVIDEEKKRRNETINSTKSPT